MKYQAADSSFLILTIKIINFSRTTSDVLTIFFVIILALSDIVLVAIHTDPDQAVAEMNALVSVHQAVQRRWQTNNILIMGDFNAGCSYASKKALKGLELQRHPPFTWLIADDVDTTTGSTVCAYDR